MKLLDRYLVLSVACGMILCAPPRSFAQKVNGFEPGDPPVTPKGDAKTLVGAFQGVSPSELNNQFLITTVSLTDADMLNPVSGTNAVINMTLQNFFGVSLVGIEGSGVLIPFSVSAGDSLLTFNYDFLTNESPAPFHNDFAFYTVSGGTPTTFVSAMTAQPSLVQLTDQTGLFQFHTGYLSQAISLSGLAPGNYTLGIGVEDRTTNDIPSGVLIDNVQIVPEPSVFALSTAGAGLLIGVRRRIRRG